MHPYSYLALSLFTTEPDESPNAGAVAGWENGFSHSLASDVGSAPDFTPLRLGYLSQPAGPRWDPWKAVSSKH
jgi:hypothetical protein